MYDVYYRPTLPTWEQLSPHISDELLQELIHVDGTPMTGIQKDFWNWVHMQDWS